MIWRTTQPADPRWATGWCPCASRKANRRHRPDTSPSKQTLSTCKASQTSKQADTNPSLYFCKHQLHDKHGNVGKPFISSATWVLLHLLVVILRSSNQQGNATRRWTPTNYIEHFSSTPRACESKPRLFASPPPHSVLHPPLPWPVVTYLRRECLVQVCPTKEACGKGACRKPRESVTNLCPGTAAQACHKPNVFDSQPHHASSKVQKQSSWFSD